MTDTARKPLGATAPATATAAKPQRPRLRQPRSLRLEALGAAAALLPALAAAQSTPAPAAPSATSSATSSATTTTTGDKPASDKPAAAPVTQLPEVKARAQAIDPNPNAQTGVPYKARTSGDERHTRPIAETPQTLQVITRKAIEESGATDLRTILNAQPGITIGTGENGNAFGDRYIIRGQEARSDVFVDGLRDPGMTIRESFAVEQVEISKGPNSSFAGRGTAGGAVNAITKQATLDYDFKRISLGVGSDGMHRVTLDANQVVTDQLALRVNALHAAENVPDRTAADRSRQGLALSGTYEFTPALTLTLDYYGLRARDKPDLGSYLVGTVPNRVPARNVPVYAQQEDFIDSRVDAGTARLSWKIDPATTLTSRTRYGTTDNGYVVTGARSATAYDSSNTAYSTATLSTHNGWQNVRYFAHQTNLQHNSKVFGRSNEFIGGLEYTDHAVVKGSYDIAAAGAYNCRSSATATANNAYCIFDSAGNVVGNLGSLTQRSIAQGVWNANWQIKTLALSAMDTLDLSDAFTLFAGVRADRFDYTLGTRSTAGVEARYGYKDTLWNGHLGLTWKLAPGLVGYVSTASAADINGGESDTGTSSGYGGAVIYNGQIAGAEPEKSRNWELGLKWDLFDGKLLATAALFRTVKSGVMEGANYDSVGTFNTGKNRVQGLELGLVGQLSERVSGQLGYTWMASKVLESATASNVGLPLSNFADRSGMAQLKVQATEQFYLGGTVRYESLRCAGQPDTGAGYTNGQCAQPVPAYTVFDAFTGWRFSPKLEARLNITNLTNKDYYLAAYRSGSFLYKGDARAVRMTVDYSF